MDNKSWLISKKVQIAGILIFVLLLGLGGFFGYKKYTSDYSLIEYKITQSQKRVDSILIKNKELEEKVSIFEDNILKIDQDLLQLDKNINKIKRDTDEKIRNVDNYTPSELQSFFTNRYRFNKDSIR